MFSRAGPARALVRRPAHAHAPHLRLRQLATKIFDGTLKAHHRERAALAPDFGNYSYLHEEVARRLLDRLDDIHESYEFSDAVDLSCGPGHVRRLLDGRGVQRMLEFDSSGAALPCAAALRHARPTHAPRTLPHTALPLPSRARALSLSLSRCTSLCELLLRAVSPGTMLALSATDAAGPNPPEFEVTQLPPDTNSNPP